MKASIKFREDQKPLLRAKVPISILSFPFQSGIAAGDSKELSLSLRTFFNAGPSLRFSYRPNDSQKPFSFVLKTGIGHFGSPDSSPFTMSAEFNLIGNQNPSFFVHFKPRFGDFCVKKSHSSSDLVKSFSSDSKLNGAAGDLLGTKVLGDHANFFDPKFRVPTPESAVNGVVEKLFSGATVSARTSLPLKSRAVVSFCWGLRFPLESREDDGVLVGKKTDRMANISFRNLPLLVMNKICIEHVAAKDNSKKGPAGNADVGEEPGLKLQRQLELIQAEIGLLRNAQNDFRAEIVDSERRGSKFYPGARGSQPDKKQSDASGLKEKTSDDLNGKLKKAI
ncbi:unnamed protein product [Cuscuta campestris]|uniref:Uncharacterized protein n=1 Tax=Cuscuta campestris TaxID=132261 RepID=A0A484KAS9_9ASTE|nr:unnamed protein product [Cuscuta campestris]